MAEIVHIEDSDILKHAQTGDMIQFTRGYYSHWAIYVGKLMVDGKRYSWHIETFR